MYIATADLGQTLKVHLFQSCMPGLTLTFLITNSTTQLAKQMSGYAVTIVRRILWPSDLPTLDV